MTERCQLSTILLFLLLSGDSSTKGEGNGFSGSSDSTASEQLAYAQTLIQQQQQIIKSQEDVIQSLTANTKELEKQIKNANELIAQYKEQEKKLVEDLQQRDNVLQEIVSLLQTQNVSIPDDVRSLLEANTAKNEG
jgi:septal ring factor EnvC (AmiA/AmiB activator)